MSNGNLLEKLNVSLETKSWWLLIIINPQCVQLNQKYFPSDKNKVTLWTVSGVTEGLFLCRHLAEHFLKVI